MRKSPPLKGLKEENAEGSVFVNQSLPLPLASISHHKPTAMHKIFTLAIIMFVLFTTCQTSTGYDTKTDTTKVAADTITYPYKPSYGADFDLGDPKYAKIILEIWKDFDDNTLTNHRAAFADTMAAGLMDGSDFYGPSDSMLAHMAAYRGSLASATSKVATWVTLKPKGKQQVWVSIWGQSTEVQKDGSKDSLFLNESWMFNKDGKIVYMEQLSRKTHK